MTGNLWDVCPDCSAHFAKHGHSLTSAVTTVALERGEQIGTAFFHYFRGFHEKGHR